MEPHVKGERHDSTYALPVLVALIALVAGAACTTQSIPTCSTVALPASPLNVTYTDPTYGFSVSVPADWDTTPVDFIAFDALDPAVIVEFSIIVEDMTGVEPPLSLDQYFTSNLLNSRFLTAFIEISRSELVIAGYDAREIVYTYDEEFAGPQEASGIWFIRDSLGFNINIIVNEGCSAQFQATIDAIIASLTFATAG